MSSSRLDRELLDLRRQFESSDDRSPWIEQLLDIAERFELVTRGTEEAIWDWNLLTDEVYFAPRYYELLGLEVLSGPQPLTSWTDRLHPDDRPLVFARLEEHRRTDTAFDVEYRLRHAGGQYRWFRSRAATQRDQLGRPVRMAGSIGDITHHKLLEKLKRESARAAGIGGWQYEIAPPALHWTQQTHAIHGTDPERDQVDIEDSIAFFMEDCRPVIRHLLRDCVECGRGFEAELRIRSRCGRIVPVQVRGIPEWEDGRVRRIYGSIQDLTPFKQLERQLFQAQKMESIGRLAGGIAHDFNNVLTAIRGYAELLGGTLDARDDRRVDIGEIIGATARAGALIDQLLTFARKQVVTPVPVDVGRLILEMRGLIEHALAERAQIDLDGLEPVPMVLVDPVQLEQVVLNLVINARDAVDPGGRVRITTRQVVAATSTGPSRKQIEIAVTDDGSGMEPQVLERIFEPFYTTKPRGRGSGLGLATCYGIVRQAGGIIEVDSRPGQGSTFRVLLPALDPAAAGEFSAD
ncbi:MAG: PAS domain-containing protein [Planctomycetes bacterium]|nr:PAS domain-containing protein [Planctomycetota bacterium]